MNKSDYKTTVCSVILFVIILIGENSSAQLPFIDKLSNPATENDTATAIQRISIDNVNKEIEFTDNLLVKKNTSEYTNQKQQTLIEEVDSINNFIVRQGKEFRNLEPDQLTHVFLINARYSWTEYYMTLRNYQYDLQKTIRVIQEQQSYYIKNKNRWEISLLQLDRSLSDQIRNHISTNFSKLERIIGDFDLKIKDLITTENIVIQDIVFADGILNDISNFREKRRAELFKQNEKSVFSINYRDSFSGSIPEQLKKAFYENTKTLSYFYSSVKKNLVLYLLLIVLIVTSFYFVRKNYIQLNFNEDYEGFFRIKRIIIEKPVLTLISTMFFLWTVLVPYTPLIITLLLYLSILVMIFVILSPVMDPFIRKIEIVVIILLTITSFQILAWYFGNFSRLYLMFEAIAGIILTHKYILPGYKVKDFRYQNKRLILSIRIITLLIFIYYSIAFFASIFGFVNLAVYCLKLGVFTGIISLLVHGFYRIISSIIQATVDVLNIYYPEIVTKYGDSIVTKLNRLLKFILGFLWFSGILRISEIYEYINSYIITFFTDKIKIGSLTFSLGNLMLFVAVLYLTYVTAKFTKRIFEREILSKHKMKRGVAASISLTIRIFLVFIGTLIALSVSGMDLSKIGIIAGALSVGIGFGLQNIVSNFISGLILVYEKPVQEGDTVEVGTLLGRVSNIGIRSSTIITYDGAEVVVPNSNLISNQLINWTLSDNQKRIEIRVGTSYSSNPHEVLKLLLIAASSHEKVLRYPEPRPLFVGFGNNSLDFRLLFWVPFEDGILTQSDVAIKIYDIFKENGIEIPFPQLDLHIKERKEKLSDGPD